MKKILSMLLYFAGASLVGFLLVLSLALYIDNPGIAKEAKFFLKQLSVEKKNIEHSLEGDISANFSDWTATNNPSLPLQGIHIGNKQFQSLAQASSMLKDGETLLLGTGVYTQPLVIRANDITVIGNGNVIIEKTAAEGKAAIITKGNNTKITNIECRNIKVQSKNGACIRHEGTNLTLTHVYFHNSQQGLLTGANPGSVTINDSRFEQLGQSGQAHGIYIGGGELTIHNSLFLAAKSEGHEIKSRAEITRITNSTIASLSSIDSRLVDISNGGILEIFNSVLQQGPTSANGDMIGYALEGRKKRVNSIELANNIFILERTGPNTLLHSHPDTAEPELRNNLIIAKDNPNLPGFNLFFETREEAGLEEYPMLPQGLSQH